MRFTDDFFPLWRWRKCHYHSTHEGDPPQYFRADVLSLEEEIRRMELADTRRLKRLEREKTE